MLYNTAATRKGLVAKFTRRILFGHWQELLKSEMSRQSVEGYNHNQTELFNHERLKDYIYWFTKFGSAEQLFGHKRLASAELNLQDLDRKNPEILGFGHPFHPKVRAYSRSLMLMTSGRAITCVGVTPFRARCLNCRSSHIRRSFR
jgi:hypothetical protein